jgi:uncharacterized paraquat-inducible protein A
MPRAICPDCRLRCRVDLKQIGRTVICPRCDTKFRAAEVKNSRKPAAAGGALFTALVVIVVIIASGRRGSVTTPLAAHTTQSPETLRASP